MGGFEVGGERGGRGFEVDGGEGGSFEVDGGKGNRAGWDVEAKLEV